MSYVVLVQPYSHSTSSFGLRPKAKATRELKLVAGTSTVAAGDWDCVVGVWIGVGVRVASTSLHIHSCEG